MLLRFLDKFDSWLNEIKNLVRRHFNVVAFAGEDFKMTGHRVPMKMAESSILDSEFNSIKERYWHRRIKTEEIAKVVAAVWGEELIQFLAELAVSVLPRTILNRINCPRTI